MSPVQFSAEPSLDTVQLIDHRTVTWNNVRHSCYWIHKRFHYTYPGPIRELQQRLVVIPPDQHGDQELSECRAWVVGAQGQESTSVDQFGNQVLLFSVPEVRSSVTFEVTLRVKRARFPDVLPWLSDAEADTFREATPLTGSSNRIATVARDLARQHHAPEALADAINTWVWQAMRYVGGVTTVATSAADALLLGRGLCQDYSHIMLAICRAAGLPARYVSGHLLGEGGSHAWVEVLLPVAQGGFVAVPFDPTNHRRANLSYITIAVGRDYRDVSPTSGTYIAPYQGRLTASKRAGVTSVEYAAA